MKKLFNIYFYLPAAFLLLLVYYPFAANIFASNTEMLDNRPLYEKPKSFSRNFSRDFEAYYNDTFAGRKKLIKKYTKIKHKLGIDSGTFFNGKNGWMFYDSGKVPDGYTLIDYFGRVQFSLPELKQMTEGLDAAGDYYKRRGIDYIAVAAPNKHGVYSEFMPDRYQKARVSEKSRMDTAIEYMVQNSHTPIVNFRNVLMKTKKEVPYEIYYPKDSHWNNIGAYAAFNELLSALNRRGYHLPVVPLTNEMISVGGKYNADLSNGEADTLYDVSYHDEMTSKKLRDEENGYIQVYENPGALSPKTMLMIRDSFGIALIPYLNKVFAKTVYLHNRYNKREDLERFIAEYQPDLVIDELVERYFDRFLKYNKLYGEEK